MGQSISQTEACDLLKNELNIREPFFVQHDGEHSLQRVVCLVNQEWLTSQMNSKKHVVPQRKFERELCIEDKTTLLQPSHDSQYDGWQRMNIIVVKKPLVKLKLRVRESSNLENSAMFDFLHEVSMEDKLNMEEYFHDKFGANLDNSCGIDGHLTEDRFKALIEETYGEKMKTLRQDEALPNLMHEQYKNNILQNDSHPLTTSQLAPVILAVESNTSFYIFEMTPQYTLNDILAFSPAIAANSAAKFQFILYQVLCCFATLGKKGLSLSPEFSSKDLFIKNSMWISFSGFDISTTDIVLEEREKQTPLIQEWLSEPPSILTPPFTFQNKLEDYTNMWIDLELTNFDYIMILNTLAGRRMKDPSHYPIYPWVMDFSKANGGFRDLTKSKYRLCKTDAQLDITFKQPAHGSFKMDYHAPHHISDHPLTSISYYVYLSRRTPKETLCQYVRSRWVPDEYPSSMERLYQWTPEECIPEFYSDPSIFKSMHVDLPDLALPSWADSPEDFIALHRNVLEGQFVSQNLHHWIDLVFGYKLYGSASIAAKNVYLSLVDGHSKLTNCGVLQLFSRPHPSRRYQNSQPRLSSIDDPDAVPMNNERSIMDSSDMASDESVFDTVTCVPGKLLEDDVKLKQPAGIRRDIWSIESAIDEAFQIDDSNQQDENETEPRTRPSLPLIPASLRQRIDTLLEGSGNEAKTPVSEDIKINMDAFNTDFIDNLERVEMELKFNLQLSPPNERGVGKHEFSSIFDVKDKAMDKKNSLVTNQGTNNTDMQLLICLIIELVLHDYTRLRTQKLNLTERLEANVRLMDTNLHRFPRPPSFNRTLNFEDNALI